MRHLSFSWVCVICSSLLQDRTGHTEVFLELTPYQNGKCLITPSSFVHSSLKRPLMSFCDEFILTNSLKPAWKKVSSFLILIFIVLLVVKSICFLLFKLHLFKVFQEFFYFSRIVCLWYSDIQISNSHVFTIRGYFLVYVFMYISFVFPFYPCPWIKQNEGSGSHGGLGSGASKASVRFLLTESNGA